MLVLPSGVGLPEVCDLLKSLLEDPLLQHQNSAFLSQPHSIICSDTPTLYVHQAECASVSYTQEPPDLHIGSDDATTCVILAARCPVTGRAYVSHHDTGTIQGNDEDLLRSILAMEKPEIYLVVLACLWTANFIAATQGPATRGLALHCASGNARPAGFEDRGPELPRRTAHSTCSVFTGDDDSMVGSLVPLAQYDMPGKIRLPGFGARLPSWHLLRLERMLKLPDEELSQMSTSPQHEAPHFLADMRAQFAWMLEMQKQEQDPKTTVYERVYRGDYKRVLSSKLEGEERQKELSACHERGAERLLQLCFANGGVYTKLGQHIGQLNHLLPEEYVMTMRNNLLDRCPVSSYKEVSKIIRKDLGDAPDKIFKRFEHYPIASASLAQVHVAEDHAGNKLAVKVQHEGLRESADADIATIQTLVNIAKYLFPTFDYQWLVDEIKFNLPRELDFLHEAQNAERCRANFASKRSKVRGRVHVPDIHLDRSSHRVLTMEFVQGESVLDLAALQRLGVNPSELSRTISKAFTEMIFLFGDVHCDPHAANLLVRKKDGKAELVLLDHGLYRRIDDKFRLEYAKLWQALIYGDAVAIKQHAEAMNAGDMYPLFVSMLTQRPWEQVVNESSPDRMYVKESEEHRKRVQAYAMEHAVDITTMLTRVPRPLLLLLKTNDCLRSVDCCLGQPVELRMALLRLMAWTPSWTIARQKEEQQPNVAGAPLATGGAS
ncbi:ABC1 family-domain-containing protein [Dunaliella salina]|uniref:ABC1 family-domain-containing protein n=1 Tax=Dunaliella salina TaxID=3046 RepID=A0ABQ7HA36_DUNSA|nr:ABC1 family-domain-containing protein [Dunaliella salina]|eukprot:KAF5843718.1 ABC1 family-domain-containing protein [Dunaliella salina]